MKTSNSLKKCICLILISTIFILLYSTNSSSEEAKKAVDYTATTNKGAAESQIKIDVLDEKTRQLLEEYRSLVYKADSLNIYCEQLKKLIKSQAEEKKSLIKQKKDIALVRREIMPLMQRMIDTLEKFISLDIPFLPKERAKRIKKLREMMIKPNITLSDKYRRVLEAYQIENDYGRTYEVYRAKLDMNKTQLMVDYLRMGRVALYYQTLDGKQSGFWDNKTHKWLIISDSHNAPIKKGIRIARKQSTPELLDLLLHSPEVVK